jgi:23S rRNA (uracil1939-C5)-methyltransferase
MQTNTAAAAGLYAGIRPWAAPSSGSGRARKIWDIYAGVGALGFFLAEKEAELLGVEREAAAVAAAERNAGLLGFTRCRFLSGDAAKTLPKLEGKPDLLLLDPPRSGLAPGMIPAIKSRKPEKIIYVSCDPASLARDLGALAPEYRLRDILAADMFPHTPHVETAALLA